MQGEVKIQFYAQKHAAAPVGFTTSDDRAVLIPPSSRDSNSQNCAVGTCGPFS